DNLTNDDTPTFSGTAEANATVTLYDTDGTTVVGTGSADGSGNWSITVSTLSTGAHTVTAKATDAAGNTSVASTGLAITIDTTAPNANDDTGDATEPGTSAAVDATGNVITNDSDTHTMSINAVGGAPGDVGAAVTGTHGTFTINSNGSYTYAVNAADSAVDALATSTDTLTDAIVYTVQDAAGNTSTATLTVTIHGANDAPTSAADSVTFDEDTAQTLDASHFGSFADVDTGDSLKSVRIVTLPANGVLALNGTPVSAGDLVTAADLAANLLVYTPAANDNTDESLTFKVLDQSDAESATYTLTLDLTPVDDLPTGNVTISGTGLAGNTLTATNTLADVDGIGVISYQWNSDGTPIGGATSDTYLLGSADVGTVISVTATYIDGDGNTDSVTEAMTSAIGAVIVPTPGSTTLIGSPGNDVLAGGNARETMLGGDGDDVYLVGRGDVVIELAGEGVDTVQATDRFELGDFVENVLLVGNRKATATGNSLDNIITGNSASNTLIGGGGADTLTGGLGADTFSYLSVSDSASPAIDVITDFDVTAREHINLSVIDADVTRDGNQKFKFIGAANFSDFASAAGLVRFDAATHMLQASIDGDTDAELEVELLGVTSLVARDFVL
ncbi:Ig-like domain-containing protein, partial [Ramlibacter sp. PS4R-6]|uniref:Ig-like domain-containing protein n=1 Tax=Ramlibacter sp. PS4R-6 TaxID=3133438 RepID=UPI0030A265C6